MTKAWNDNQLLLHMALLLFSLSEMALRADCLPFAQRLVLFAAMRQGEAAARKIAIRAGVGAAFIILHRSDVPDEALRLALTFRYLAVALMNAGLRDQRVLAQRGDLDRPLQIALISANFHERLTSARFVPAYPDTS